MSELETVAVDAAQPTPDVAPVADVAATETPTEAVETSLDDDLSAAYDAAVGEPLRGPDGKFVSREPNTEAVEPETAPAEAKTEDQTVPDAEKAEPAAPAIDPPTSWSREMREKWTGLPPEAQQYIAQRESEAHSQISRLGQQVKAFEPVARSLEQYRPTFERNGMDYAQGIEALLSAQAMLDANPRAAIHEIARTYGVDLSGADDDASQTMPGRDVLALQAELAEVKRQNAETRSKLDAYERWQAETRQAAVQSEIDAFSKESPYFNDVQTEVALMIPVVKELFPNMSERQLLEQATKFAVRINETTFAKAEAERRAKEAEAAKLKAAEAKKVSSLNVKSTTAARPAARTLEDDLSASFDRIHSRAS